jgi:hypothetical protein
MICLYFSLKPAFGALIFLSFFDRLRSFFFHFSTVCAHFSTVCAHFFDRICLMICLYFSLKPAFGVLVFHSFFDRLRSFFFHFSTVCAHFSTVCAHFFDRICLVICLYIYAAVVLFRYTPVRADGRKGATVAAESHSLKIDPSIGKLVKNHIVSGSAEFAVDFLDQGSKIQRAILVRFIIHHHHLSSFCRFDFQVISGHISLFFTVRFSSHLGSFLSFLRFDFQVI